MKANNPDVDGASLGHLDWRFRWQRGPTIAKCLVLMTGLLKARRWNHRWILTWRIYCRRDWRCRLGTVESGLGEVVGGAVGSGFGADVGLIVGLGLGGDVGAELDLSSDLGSVEETY